MALILNPPDSVGPVTVGMTIDEAEEALRSIEGFSRIGIEDAVVEMRGFATYANGMTISVDTGPGGVVAAIEVFRPLVASPVVLDGVDVFTVPADELIRRYSSLGEIVSEERGRRVVVPDRADVADLFKTAWRGGVHPSSATGGERRGLRA